MEINPFKLNELSDLPNQEGFKFIGIDDDYNEHLCIVVKDSIGCHTVNRISDNEPFFTKLMSWKSLTKKEVKNG
jgi:hypothetical protein